MVDHLGECDIREADYLNVPVDIWIEKDHDEFPGRWVLHADNYMPRKGQLYLAYHWTRRVRDRRCYFCVGDTREELVELLLKYVRPLYQTALDVIDMMSAGSADHLYHWKTPLKEDRNEANQA